MMRLVQLRHPSRGRCVARVEEPHLCVLTEPASIYAMAGLALQRNTRLADLAASAPVAKTLDYESVHSGASEWRLLPAFDHPGEPARCLVSGTGLTHTASAKNRDAMHGGTEQSSLTDTMRMFRLGLEGGKPEPGEIGVPPEWFYKGDGSILRAHGESLEIPAYSGDGGEEPELAGCYFIAPDGSPRRVGFAAGNEFSDHVHERKNYLYLAESKLRDAAIGPELLVGELAANIDGKVAIERAGAELWSSKVATGEDNMCHSLVNLEHHHFKHSRHRRPGDAHVHFFGADAFSFGAGVRLQDGDTMVISWNSLGRPLRNPLRRACEKPIPVRVKPL